MSYNLHRPMQEEMSTQFDIIYALCKGQRRKPKASQTELGSSKQVQPTHQCGQLKSPTTQQPHVAKAWVPPHRQMLLAGMRPVQEGLRLMLRCV